MTETMTWVWVNSGSWWWTGRPGVLWFMGSQRVGQVWATELNWTEIAGRGHRSTHQQKIGLKIYWAWPHLSEQDPVSPSVSLSHQEASISFLSFSIRRQTEIHNHRKLSNLIIWTTALCNSMKLRAMPCRATQDGSWYRVLTKCGPLENAMATHFSILALRTPWTVWKSKKIDTERWTPQVGRCPICYWRSVEKQLQKEWRDRAKAKTTPSCGCDWWWK